MMKLFLALALITAALACAQVPPVSFAPASAATSGLADDWTANFTLNVGGLNFTGWMVYHKKAQRTFRRIHELNESSFSFSDFQEPMLYKYDIMSSGCTCQTTKAGFIPNFFGSFVSAVKSGSCENGGTLYKNHDYKMLPGTPSGDYCVDASTNAPIWYESNVLGEKYEFTNFQAGINEFPFEYLNGWEAKCAAGCL